MRTASLFVLLLVLLVAPVFGGEIYGSIELNGKAIEAGVEVRIKCASMEASVTTDEIGNYRFYVKEKGKCTLTVAYGQEPFPSIDVYSYDGTVRFDLALEGGEGGYRLKRR